MYLSDGTDCCGLEMMNGLRDHSTVESAIKKFQSITRGYNAPFVVYTMPVNEKIGEDFTAFIKENKLGTVIQTKAVLNPNSLNDLVIYTWTVNWKAVRAWGKAVAPKRKVATRSAR